MKTLKDLCHWRFSIVPAQKLSAARKQVCDSMCQGMSINDRLLVEGIISRADMRQFSGDQNLENKAIRQIIKTLHFLKFFDARTTLKVTDAKGQSSEDDMSVYVKPPINQPPVANGGPTL